MPGPQECEGDGGQNTTCTLAVAGGAHLGTQAGEQHLRGVHRRCAARSRGASGSSSGDLEWGCSGGSGALGVAVDGG